MDLSKALAFAEIAPIEEMSQRITIPSSSTQLAYETRPLLNLIETGTLQSVNATTLYYMSDEYVALSGLSREDFKRKWYSTPPLITGIADTFLGRLAFIMLPILNSDLYAENRLLTSLVEQACALTETIGGDIASLTGLIPSALNYGENVSTQNSRITTGHAVTVSSVVLMVKKVLEESGRPIQNEQVGVLGLGSIGWTSLRLILHYLPHPKTLILADIFKKQDELMEIKEKIKDIYGFKGDINLLFSDKEVPDDFYQSTLIIGATNVPDSIRH